MGLLFHEIDKTLKISFFPRLLEIFIFIMEQKKSFKFYMLQSQKILIYIYLHFPNLLSDLIFVYQKINQEQILKKKSLFRERKVSGLLGFLNMYKHMYIFLGYIL